MTGNETLAEFMAMEAIWVGACFANKMAAAKKLLALGDIEAIIAKTPDKIRFSFGHSNTPLVAAVNLIHRALDFADGWELLQKAVESYVKEEEVKRCRK